MKIDVFTHVYPAAYREKLERAMPRGMGQWNVFSSIPTLYDLDQRFRMMDAYGDLRQVLTITGPSLEAPPLRDSAVMLARLANDTLAELTAAYPQRFVAAAASLPLHDMDASLREAERAIEVLGFRGVQIPSIIGDASIDSPEFLPLFQKMALYDLPLFIHPATPVFRSDFTADRYFRHGMHITFGWVYETSIAMAQLVFSGIFDTYPDLKVIVHHAGAMVPFLGQRIAFGYDMPGGKKGTKTEKKRPVDYFKMFYCDTAIQGNTAGLMCSRWFFGADRMLFGSDTPFDSEYGNKSLRETISSIEEMAIPDGEKTAIFEGNARRLLRLP